MAQIFRRVILSQKAYEYLGFAEEQLAALELRRVQTGAPKLKKALVVNDITMVLSVTEFEKKVIMWGGGDPIMLFGTAGNPTETTWYNYLSDTLGHAANVDATGELHAFVNGVCHVADGGFAQYRSRWTKGKITDGVAGTPLGVAHWDEVEAVATGPVIHGRTPQGVGVLGAVSGGEFHPDLAVTNAGGFELSVHPTSPQWNLYQGVSMIDFNPADSYAAESWIWSPSLFSTTYDDPVLTHGFYYGAYPYSPITTPDGAAAALKYAHIKLLALMEVKDNSPDISRQAGWAEMVVEWEGHVDQLPRVPSDVIGIYFQSYWPESDSPSSFYNEESTISFAQAQLAVGSLLTGHSSYVNFTVRASTPGVVPDEVKLWNFKTYVSPEDESNFARLEPPRDRADLQSGLGIIVVEGSHARLYRHRIVGATLVYETHAFHSYAISQDGKVVAMLDKDEFGKISKVNVWDFCGTRDQLETEPAEYVGSAVQHLRTRGDFAPRQFVSSCFIPFRRRDARGKEIVVPPFDLSRPSLTVAPLDRADPTDITESVSAYGALYFQRNGAAPLTMYKLECENGVDAYWNRYVDPCFESTVIIDDPRTQARRDKVVAKNEGDAGLYIGIHALVRGDFEKQGIDELRFRGIGVGSEITLPNTFSIGQELAADCLRVVGAVGEFSPGSCLLWLDEDERCLGMDPECARRAGCNGGTVEYSATTSCGQTGGFSVEIPAPEPGHFRYPDQWVCGEDGTGGLEPGDSVEIEGGTGPVTYSISCGALVSPLSPAIASLEGCCGQVEITAHDEYCGKSYPFSVRTNVGQYVVISGDIGETWDKYPGILDTSYCVESECSEGAGGMNHRYVTIAFGGGGSEIVPAADIGDWVIAVYGGFDGCSPGFNPCQYILGSGTPGDYNCILPGATATVDFSYECA